MSPQRPCRSFVRCKRLEKLERSPLRSFTVPLWRSLTKTGIPGLKPSGEYGGIEPRRSTSERLTYPCCSIFAETDCLLSLAKSSADMDEPKVRPEIVPSDSAYIDFEDLRHPCMSLRTDFIANDIKLGGDVARQVLLTGPSKLRRSCARSLFLTHVAVRYRW
jgi:hypothetical protein